MKSKAFDVDKSLLIFCNFFRSAGRESLDKWSGINQTLWFWISYYNILLPRWFMVCNKAESDWGWGNSFNCLWYLKCKRCIRKQGGTIQLSDIIDYFKEHIQLILLLLIYGDMVINRSISVFLLRLWKSTFPDSLCGILKGYWSWLDKLYWHDISTTALNFT